jgi:hypothetical protein
MSDPVPAPVSVEASATGVVDVVPAPAPEPVVLPLPVPATVDFSDLTDVLKLALSKIAEVEMQGDLAVDEKIKKVAEIVKAEIRKADLPLAVRTAAMDWVNDALPHVIKAVDLVKAEVKKAALAEADKLKDVALAEVRKCCPSFFTKKV